jgi:hypothetical protein
MRTSSAIAQQFQSQGYVKLAGFLELEQVDRILYALVTLLAKKDPTVERLSHVSKAWENPEFHSAVIALRRRDPQGFSEVYSAIKSSPALLSLFSGESLSRAAAEFIGCDAKAMWVGEFLGRMDVPDDVRNNLGWHQEHWYYPQTIGGRAAVVCWVPLQDTGSDLGTIKVCEGSHNTGLDRYQAVKGGSNLTSKTFLVPDEELAKFEPISVDANKGDVVFFHMHTFHRSGTNSTSQVRFTATCRFFNVNSPFWVPHEPIITKI